MKRALAVLVLLAACEPAQSTVIAYNGNSVTIRTHEGFWFIPDEVPQAEQALADRTCAADGRHAEFASWVPGGNQMAGMLFICR